ncbi:unnamed protein product [Brassicogethes aeneus]|uniref:Tetraspanin n=1 Tax=Brassicogethes aeneus TaxID=1431903 RepID=A0A9P0FFE7_BRAAE|nr:unnamed protein product [Brassicogethes aeneus]
MVSGGMTCVKYLIFLFNLLFVISGITLLVVGGTVLLFYAHYSNFVYPSYQSAPIVLIIVGIIIFVIAFFGCCGAVKENHCMIITFSIFLLVIVTLELAAGIVGYIRRNDVEVMLENKLNSTMYQYNTDMKIRNSWDIAQHEAVCCGMTGPEDWVKINNGNKTLPHTCCPDTPDDGSCKLGSPNVIQDSCMVKLKEMMQQYGAYIGAVGIGIALSQFIGVIFACCLARSIRREYETV